MKEIFGGAYLFIVVFLIVLVIAWIIMPFAIIGTKPLLRDLIKELKENNRLLVEIRSHVKPVAAPKETPGGRFGSGSG